jgi:diguanylate cyclase (GGDEF)-like protein/PAS domain S-box-containing protein
MEDAVDDVERFGPALAGAMTHVSDMVTIMDEHGNFEYVNPFGLEVFGYESADELIGTPMLDTIHPDDLPRVMIAMARMLDPEVPVPGRPALLRIRRADGSYVRVEANGSIGSSPGTSPGSSANRVVVTARPTIDADLHEQLMSVLTTGAPSEKSFELVPAFGEWRQPNLLHAVFVLDDEGRPLAYGSSALLALGALDDPRAPWAAVAQSGEELFVAIDELADAARERAAAAGLTHLRARPVVDDLHRSHGVVVIAHDATSPLPDERSTLEFSWYALDKMADVLEIALAWRFQAAELRRAAATDPLTGLANRSGFWSRFERTAAAIAHESVTVLCVDLDRFKPVNDTHGHAVGDALLVEVADRLRRVVRPGDLVARVGGDEFTVVVHDLAEDQVAGIADRIVTELGAPFAVGGHAIEIGASVGVAGAPVEEFDAEGLLDAADTALYEAKNSGRTRWVRADTATGP